MARRKTTEEYRRDLAAYTDKIICLDEYANAKTKIRHQCMVCGHQRFVSPDSIFYGYGCPKCAGNLRRTTEEYKNELASVTDKIICLDEYVNNKTKIRHRCTVCGHQWLAKPSSLLQGTGCPKCSNRALKTTEEYRKELAAITDTIICLGEYENAKTKIQHQCMVCGYQWLVSPDAMLQGRHCPECVGLKRKNTEEYKNELASVTDKIICLDEYVNSNTKIKHQCITCGHEWFVIPISLLRGSGCPKCAGNLRKTAEKYRNELAALTDTILCVDEYINDRTKILHRCITCGHEWFVTPSSLLQGTGCPVCCRRSTSYVEQVITCAFKHIFGDDNVLSRNRSVIGKELDVYIPELNFAVEFGAWYWHEKRLSNDIEKYRICCDKNIRLITIYDECSKGSCFQDKFFKNNDVWLYDKFLDNMK